MVDKQSSIYYQRIEDFDFDRACSFLEKKGISLLNKPYDGKIIALDDEGDDYEISYEQTKQKALSSNMFNVKIWLDYKWRVIWTFRLSNNCFVLDFHLFSLFEHEKNLVSKAFFDFFKSEVSYNPKFLLGMVIDKNGETYEEDFDPVFTTDSEEVDYVTDLICLPQKKFDELVIMKPGFAKKELNNGFVCASRYPEFLNYILN